jgi:hypothetical protein
MEKKAKEAAEEVRTRNIGPAAPDMAHFVLVSALGTGVITLLAMKMAPNADAALLGAGIGVGTYMWRHHFEEVGMTDVAIHGAKGAAFFYVGDRLGWMSTNKGAFGVGFLTGGLRIQTFF